MRDKTCATVEHEPLVGVRVRVDGYRFSETETSRVGVEVRGSPRVRSLPRSGPDTLREHTDPSFGEGTLLGSVSKRSQLNSITTIYSPLIYGPTVKRNLRTLSVDFPTLWYTGTEER